jgi:hypothetical protein
MNERMLGLVHKLERLIDCHMLQSSKSAPKTNDKIIHEENIVDFDSGPTTKPMN